MKLLIFLYKYNDIKNIKILLSQNIIIYKP